MAAVKHYAILGFALVLLGGCDVQPPEESRAAPVSEPPQALAEESQVESLRARSRVENSLRIEATLAEESKSENVTVEELVSAIYRLTMATVSVRPPYPEHLWISFRLVTNRAFPEVPVVLKMSFLADDREVESRAVVLGESTRSLTRKDGMEVLVDIMPVFATVPATTLVVAHAEGHITPEGTDEASVDPETVSVAPDDIAVLFSNPVRVNFMAAEGGL